MVGRISLGQVRQVVEAVAPLARSYRSLRDATRRLPTYDTVFGFAITGDSGIDTSRRASGETDFFLRAIKTADLVVDIGANVGFFTLLAALNGVPVTAVEPSTGNVKLLLRNLERVWQSLEATVEVYPVAVGAEPGVQIIYGAGQGASLVDGWGGIRATHACLTPVTTVDLLVADRLKVTGGSAVIKLDVEGYEFEVLRGSKRTLGLEPSPTWIVEHALTHNFSSGSNPHFRRFFEVFWAAGYSAHTIEDILITESDVDGWIRRNVIDAPDINFIFRR